MKIWPVKLQHLLTGLFAHPRRTTFALLQGPRLGPFLLQLFAQGGGFKLGHIVSAAVFDGIHIHSSEILHSVPRALGWLILLPEVPSLAPWRWRGDLCQASSGLGSELKSQEGDQRAFCSLPRKVGPGGLSRSPLHSNCRLPRLEVPTRQEEHSHGQHHGFHPEGCG